MGPCFSTGWLAFQAATLGQFQPFSGLFWPILSLFWHINAYKNLETELQSSERGVPIAVDSSKSTIVDIIDRLWNTIRHYKAISIL